ncbi:histidine phosphatase family protein [Aestuariicella hydrocarbonica]|uniref:Histidine phosphatase family protein n=1 Tax=Pseudomaricurvus hydrocarbonicus TaxID=1470433 RepID=A0A9E5MJN3_9GAMM|nr:histidine phosphatase family protein [Aestuariicella hydrocarbonica]NHO64252.1 histidine phosphatase family protein [Aestuariicella hydrocarbonica]
MNQQRVTTLDFLRHGECQDTLHKGQKNTDSHAIFRGRTDSPLNETGWHQMNQAIQHWHTPLTEVSHSWEKILSSPLKRCQTFAEQLAEFLKLPVETRTALREIDFGDWDGQLIQTIEQQSPQALARFWQNPTQQTPPNGESLSDFHQRVIKAFDEIVQTQQNQHCLVVCHGGVIKSVMAHCLNMPLDSVHRLSIPHACMTQIQIFHQPGFPDWIQLTRHQPPPAEIPSAH